MCVVLCEFCAWNFVYFVCYFLCDLCVFIYVWLFVCECSHELCAWIFAWTLCVDYVRGLLLDFCEYSIRGN